MVEQLPGLQHFGPAVTLCCLESGFRQTCQCATALMILTPQVKHCRVAQ